MDAFERMALDLENAQTLRYCRKKLMDKVNFYKGIEEEIYSKIVEFRAMSRTYLPTH